MKQVKSFTIWELIVVMVISGIVITLGANALLRIQHHFILSSDQFSSGSQVIQVKNLIDRDIENSIAVLKRGGGIWFSPL